MPPARPIRFPIWRRNSRSRRARSGSTRTKGCSRPLRRGQTRVYGERERTRIKLILRGKRLGLALSEIRELFDIYATTGNERPQLAKFLQMLADRRAMLLQQREDIDAVLVEIGAPGARLPPAPEAVARRPLASRVELTFT